MKKIYIISLLMIASFYKLSAEYCDTSNIIFGISKEDAIYLRYIYIQNSFDSALVEYTFGEFRILNDSSEVRVPIAFTMNSEINSIRGDNAFGEDKVLRKHLITNSFIVPANPKVKFFRHISASKAGNISFPPDPNHNGWDRQVVTWQDYIWVVGQGRIKDRSEFIIELVRKSDDIVVYKVDSVGVAPNPNSVVAQRYGTEPDKINHTRILPDSLVGMELYARISPRRWGPTPLGMELKILPRSISQSSIYEFDSGPPASYVKQFTPELYQAIDNKYYNRLMFYFDSVKSTIGHLPSFIPSLINLNSQQKQIFFLTFFDTLITIYGDTALVDKEETQNRILFFKNNSKVKFDYSKEGNFRIDKVIPTPLDDLNLNVTIDSKSSISNVKLELYSSDGRFIKDLWTGNITKGLNSVKGTIDGVASGAYYLMLLKDNVIFATKKIIK